MNTTKFDDGFDGLLVRQREQLDQLKSWEHELDVLKEIEAELEVEKISAVVALESATAKHDFGVESDDAAAIAVSLVHKRELERAMAARSRSASEAPASSETEASALQSGIEALNDWLDADTSAARWRRPRIAYGTIGAASVATIFAATTVHPMLLVLMVPLVMALGYLAFTERDADWIRLGAIRRFAQTGLPAPVWSTAEVRSRLSEIQTALSNVGTRPAELGDVEIPSENDTLAQEASEMALALELVQANDELDKALRRAGVDRSRIDEEFGGWLQQVYDVRRVSTDLAEASLKRKSLSRAAEETRDAIFRFLALNDAAPGRGRADVKSLDASLRRLAERKGADRG